MKSWKAELLLLFITVIWGATFTFTKLGLNDCSPFFFIFLRFSIAFVIVATVWGKYLIKIDRRTFLHGIILGILYAGGFALQTLGLEFTSVTKSAFITGMSVVLTPFAFKLVIKRRIDLYAKIGVVIATIGLWIFTNPSIDNINLGDILTLFSAFFWAFYITFMDVFTKEIKSFEKTVQLVMLQFMVIAIISFSGYLIFEIKNLTFILSENLFMALIYNGIIASVILTLIHTSIQKYSTPVKAALIFSLEPVFATIVALLFISETLNPLEATGAAILFLGVLFSETGSYILGRASRSTAK